MTGMAALARELADRPAGHLEGLRGWPGRDAAANAVTALAISEIVVDKLPGVPDRIEPGPLAVRGFLGAVVGALAGGEEATVTGAVIGAAAAIAAARVGWAVRKEAGWATGLPDAVIAAAEDAIAISIARAAARQV